MEIYEQFCNLTLVFLIPKSIVGICVPKLWPLGLIILNPVFFHQLIDLVQIFLAFPLFLDLQLTQSIVLIGRFWAIISISFFEEK